MSSQIKNLKPLITKEKVKRLSILFFSLLLTLAIFSQISYGNAKPKDSKKCNSFIENCELKIENSASPSDWLYYKSNNDIIAYLGKKDTKLPTVRYQKNNDYLEFSMAGVSSTTAVSLETNVKTPNTPTLFYRNIFDGVDANYQITNVPFRVKEEIVLQSIKSIKSIKSKVESQNTNLPPTSFLFSAETTAKPVKQKDGSIAFFDNKGDYLFQLDKPFMIDGKGTRSEEVSIEIVSMGQNKSPQRNNGFNFKFLNSNFESIFNDLIFKHLNIPPFIHSKFSNYFKIQNSNFIQNSKLEIKNYQPQHYQIILKASSDWLNDPSRVYPVVIDPTVTHNADANFTGQFNRIADSDTTTSTQLESSYPEATKDPYTVLLLHFNEANGTTAGIRDYASTTRVITANGNASTTNSVTQLGLGNSAAFDGTGDYLSVPDSSDFDFGTGDFTVDFWIYSSGATVYDGIISGLTTSAGGGSETGWQIVFLTSQKIRLTKNNGTSYLLTSNIDITTNKWHHVALVRNGVGTNNLAFYIDGVLDVSGDGNVALNAETNGVVVGRLTTDTNGDYFSGSLDSLRILKGRALTPEEIKASASRRPYSVYTSSVLDASASVQWDTLNWTEGGVNTGDGETPYSTNSLVAQWNFNDTSGTTLTASSSGSCTTACNGTLTNFAYTASQDQATTTTGWTANNKRWGAGGLMFDGTNDYVSVGDNAGFDFGTGDLTIETWINPSTLSTGAGSEKGIISTYNSTADNGWRLLYYNSELLFQHLTAGSADFVQRMSFTPADSIGKWNHIAVVVSSGSATIYKNGFVTTSVSTAGTSINGDTGNNGLVIGNVQNNPAANQYFQGIIDSTRIYKGRALSASEILSNYQAGNIEIQTRTGATSDPNDGTWEAWKPTTGETQLLSMDSDAGNWNAPQQIDGYTKLLLHMDGTDTATTFPNSATTTHTVTANGNAQVDTAQSKFSGASGLFDGTGDGVRIDGNADFAFAADFTIDTWIRTTSTANMHFYGTTNEAAWTTDAWHMGYYNGNLVFGVFTNANTQTFASGSLHDGNWHHIAITRSGATIRMFADGVEKGSFTDSRTLGNATFRVAVGAQDPTMSSEAWNGWLDEFRISKGIARWTSNFTPPPRAYGSNVKAENETTIKQEGTGSTKLTLGAPQIDGNTVALWHFEETGTTTGTYLYDETANNNDATTTGTTVVDGIFGKARKFNGTSDYVSVADSDNWNFGSGDFSIDAWVNFNHLPTSNEAIASQWGSNNRGWVLAKISDNATLNFAYSTDGSASVDTNFSWMPSPSANTWYHIAIARFGSDLKAFVNGRQIGTTYNIGVATLYNSTRSLNIGADIGSPGSFNKGTIDSVRIIKGRALSADEIAETYRMGANHHLTRQVSAVDLSGANKLAFNVASDRPGTYLEAMLGESDYANYELASSTLALSTTTVLYIKGDEIASSTSLKDSSFSGKAITANGNARTAGGGKIGNSVYFDGTGDYLTTPSNNDFTLGSPSGNINDFTVSTWIKTSSSVVYIGYLSRRNTGQSSVADGGWVFGLTNGKVNFSTNVGGAWKDGAPPYFTGTTDLRDGRWHHVAVIRNGTTYQGFTDGKQEFSVIDAGTTSNPLVDIGIGAASNTGEGIFDGYLDELRILKGTALTADQIRQAYEYGLRSHQITIDFGATLQTSDLISSATDYNFSLTATTSGLSATTSGLYLGDKIIIKENLGGTEYTAQGTVNAINTTTGAITVPSWDTGSTFPSGNGYSPNATVFKWQREYFDLTGAATTTRDAITNLTLRPTNGAEGRTIYLDDFRYNTNYLTASSSSAITSGNNRYLQYRAIFSSADSFVSPFLSAFNTLYTALANSFPSLIGVSGGGFLSF